jgi:hypothetical protein
MSEEQHWCNALKEGDSVFVQTGTFSGTSLHPAKIRRITKTQIKLEGSDTVYDKRGQERGKFRWDHSANLYPDTPENREHYEMQQLRIKLRSALLGFDKRFDLMKLKKERVIALTEILTAVNNELDATRDSAKREE